MEAFKAGTYINQGFYKSFQPELINRIWKVEDMEVLQLLGQADRLIGGLNAYAKRLPDLRLYLGMHILKESTQSAKIEGTQTNIQEALLEKENVEADEVPDWTEVNNYSRAMNWAIAELDKLPISSRLIREAHKILLEGARGKNKQPGDFRKSQNWIGGATISDARFIPPVHTSIDALMSDLEKFIHNDENPFPPLLKIAIIHYQFETIHPFLDGNGRVGRLLIPLYLVEQNILESPILYLSDFLEKNKTLYYENLTRVREANDITHWFKFFLVGIIETAKEGLDTLDHIIRLTAEIDLSIQSLGSKAENARKVMAYLYEKPLINAKKVADITNTTPATTYKLISDLERLNILNEITGGKRRREYIFGRYLDFFR
ncbi:MAG: Fic family protein [Saprospiraceae bacterium]